MNGLIVQDKCDMELLEPFINFESGNIPLIIETPHGGTYDICTIEPLSMEKICGIDAGTIKLAKEIKNEIMNKSNGMMRPTMITSNVSRNKLDLNRPKRLANRTREEFGDCLYDIYHDTISRKIDENIEEFGKSLLITIHGMEHHTIPEGFRDVELVLGTNDLKSVQRNENIRGKIIEKMLQSNISTSPRHPKGREHVLTGGHAIKFHGKKKLSDAVQLEFSDLIRMKKSDLRRRAVGNIADALINEVMQ